MQKKYSHYNEASVSDDEGQVLVHKLSKCTVT